MRLLFILLLTVLCFPVAAEYDYTKPHYVLLDENKEPVPDETESLDHTRCIWKARNYPSGTYYCSQEDIEITVTNGGESYGAFVSWTTPTENTDNSILTDLVGFNVYYGLSEDSLSTKIYTENTSILITGLSSDDNYFAVTAVNAGGVESDLSNIVSKKKIIEEVGMVAKVNFHNSGSANPQDTFGFWTNFISPADTSTIDILDFDTGSDTGWDITVNSTETSSAPDGVNAIGTGDAAWVDEARCSDTHHRLITTDNGQYIISGLDNAKTYTIDLFASRDAASSTRTGEYSVDGYSTFFELDAKLNSTVTGTFTEISPTAGEIILDWRVKSDIGSAFLNCMRITENAGGASNVIILRRRIEGF